MTEEQAEKEHVKIEPEFCVSNYIKLFGNTLKPEGYQEIIHDRKAEEEKILKSVNEFIDEVYVKTGKKDLTHAELHSVMEQQNVFERLMNNNLNCYNRIVAGYIEIGANPFYLRFDEFKNVSCYGDHGSCINLNLETFFPVEVIFTVIRYTKDKVVREDVNASINAQMAARHQMQQGIVAAKNMPNGIQT